MHKYFLVLLACALLAGCANHRVIASWDPEVVELSATELDKVSTSWGSRGGMVVTTVTEMSPSDWVRKESIRVRQTRDTITVCYSITARPRELRNIPAVATKLIFIVDGLQQGDKRSVVLSRSCAN